MEEFKRINTWKRNGERAPHKPLLILFALGRLFRGISTPMLFEDVEKDLRELLVEFGPSRKSYHPEYPFWALKNDGLWKIESDGIIEVPAGASRPKKSELLSKRAKGMFSPTVFAKLKGHPRRILAAAKLILSQNFPDSIHEDIASVIGIQLQGEEKVGKRRDPSFRSRILTAYEHRCAVCELDIRIGSVTVGLDAAHIMWHQAGGSDDISNGLALCSLHHKLFDLGAFSVNGNLNVLVSEQAIGTSMFREVLLNFHDKPLKRPIRNEDVPNNTSLEWHFAQVFKKEARPS